MVRIEARVIEAMIAHARDDSPDECCGLLVGGRLGIDEAVRTTNVERGPTRFQVSPEEHLALVKRLRGSGRKVLGAYHSHPRAPAVPSPSDVREAFYPEFIYVIVSLAGSQPDTRAWRIVGEAAAEVRIEVMGRAPA